MAFGGSIGFDLLGKDAGPVLQACTDLVYPSLHDVRRLQARHACELHGVLDASAAPVASVSEQEAVRPVAYEGVGVAPVEQGLCRGLERREAAAGNRRRSEVCRCAGGPGDEVQAVGAALEVANRVARADADEIRVARVELEGVGPFVAEHQVVALIAEDRIVPLATVDRVVAKAAVEDVVALVAQDDVVPLVSEKCVVAVTAQHRVGTGAGRDRVVATIAENEIVARAGCDQIGPVQAIGRVVARAAHDRIVAVSR